MSEKSKGSLLTLAGAACWGISGCFGQYLFLEKDMTAEWLVAIRLLVAGALVVAIGFIKQRDTMLDIFHDKRDCKKLFLFALVAMMLCQYTYFAAIERSNAGTATVLQALNAVVVLVYICFRGKRKPNKIELVAVVLALLGVFLLSTGGDPHNMALSTTALCIGLTSACCVAFYNINAPYLMNKYGVYILVGYSMLIAGIIMVPLVQPWKEVYPMDIGTLVGLFGVVVIGTAVAFSLFLKGVSIVGAFMGSLLGTSESVVAVGVSALFLGAAFSIVELIGFVFVLTMVYLLSINSAKQNKA